MCHACWEDDGRPNDRTPETARLVELIGQLYGLPECDSGGPLHCELDDWNLDFTTRGPIYRSPFTEEDWSPEVYRVGNEIISIMNRMTEDQRMTALAIHEGFIED